MNIPEAQRDAICPECGRLRGRLIVNIAETRPYRHEDDQIGRELYYYCLHCHTRFSLIAASPHITAERIER